MRRIISAALAMTLLAGSSLFAVPAKAENGQIAAGVVGGIIGGALGGALATSRPAPPPPPPTVVYREAPPPPPPAVYVEEPACHMARERYWDGYDWQYRRIRVCN